jgi:putative membrane protein insertion efficiency factor
MQKLILRLISFYQKYIPKSPDGCRYSPTCSQYFYQAVEKYGILHGSSLGIKRILRCHPWSVGGYDPLP